MTKVVVEAGIWGFSIAVEVVRLSARKVRVSVASECDMVREMNSQLGELEWQDALKPLADSPVHKAVFKHIKHPACPVLVAIVKAIEVEVGVALPRDVVIRFETTNHS